MRQPAPHRNIRRKRIYDQPDADDGARVLVDRLWPRGLSKDKAAIDRWLKEVAPSTELRRWFAHDPERWPEFRRRYAGELQSPERQQALTELRAMADDGPLTLLYATRETRLNHAAMLAELLGGDATPT